jgi:nicotinamidase-related amidase
MNPAKTALILVGYQNDYFAKDGILRGVVEDPTGVDWVLENTLAFIRALEPTEATIISTPIILAADYRAMASPVGILNTMKEVGAFKEGSVGAENLQELGEFGDRLLYVSGKVGFNAFSNTALGDVLTERGIENVLVCGMVTSLCIHTTGHAAHERGYDVTILSDCSSARTDTEHQFFCENAFRSTVVRRRALRCLAS